MADSPLPMHPGAGSGSEIKTSAPMADLSKKDNDIHKAEAFEKSKMGLVYAQIIITIVVSIGVPFVLPLEADFETMDSKKLVAYLILMWLAIAGLVASIIYTLVSSGLSRGCILPCFLVFCFLEATICLVLAEELGVNEGSNAFGVVVGVAMGAGFGYLQNKYKMVSFYKVLTFLLLLPAMLMSLKLIWLSSYPESEEDPTPRFIRIFPDASVIFVIFFVKTLMPICKPDFQDTFLGRLVISLRRRFGSQDEDGHPQEGAEDHLLQLS